MAVSGFHIKDMCNDTSRYLDDIFNINIPEFEKHIPDIYPSELLLNKANTSNKEPSFLDLNINVIGSDVHNNVYDKRDDFGFPIVNFPWLQFYFNFWISILRIFNLLPNY